MVFLPVENLWIGCGHLYPQKIRQHLIVVDIRVLMQIKAKKDFIGVFQKTVEKVALRHSIALDLGGCSALVDADAPIFTEKICQSALSSQTTAAGLRPTVSVCACPPVPVAQFFQRVAARVAPSFQPKQEICL
jgi:hypothetical protein